MLKLFTAFTATFVINV